MILNNSLSLMDENYFNFQLEMADLQTYHNVYSSALEITNESENVFVKIKNAIVNFFKKIINFIRNIFKKETKEIASTNAENKNVANTANNKKKELSFPISISGGDNVIFNLDSNDIKETLTDCRDISDVLSEFENVIKGLRHATDKEVGDVFNSFGKGMSIDIYSNNFNDEINIKKKEFDEELNKTEDNLKNSSENIKLTPGGKINSQQELDKIINLSNQNKEGKIIIITDTNANVIEKLSNNISRAINSLTLSDTKVIKLTNNCFSVIKVTCDYIIRAMNILKNVCKRNSNIINSVLNQVNK